MLANFRPHRNTTYVDVAYCYRRVPWFIVLSVTLVSPAKTAEPIKMPFGLRTPVGPGNHVIDVGKKFAGSAPFLKRDWVSIEHQVTWAEDNLHTKWHLDASGHLATIEMGSNLLQKLRQRV